MTRQHTRETTTVGEVVHIVYEAMLATYGDAELASVATAAVVNELLVERTRPARREEAA